MIFLKYPFKCDQKCLSIDGPACADFVKNSVESCLGYKDFVLYHNGRKLQNWEVVPENSTIHVTFSLCGGKGGFGSMLRAIGAQIEKTTNREACRDLSGRRLRDINEEQRLKKWIAKEAEREAEKIKRRQERIERLKRKAPHKFFDFEYEKEISELPERINEALNEGLQKAKLPQKRPLESAAGSSKLPKKSWLAEDLPLSSSDSDSDESSPSKKLKVVSNDSTSCDSFMSESLQSQPCSSKDCTIQETSSDYININSDSMEPRSTDSSSNSEMASQEESSMMSSEENSVQNSEIDIPKESEDASKVEEMTENKTEGKYPEQEIGLSEKQPPVDMSSVNSSSSPKQVEMQDDSPIDLMDYGSASDLEALGLDRLKSALMSRGLKCGGTLSDRAQRLWKIRGFQPHEYPPNLLAKSKK